MTDKKDFTSIHDLGEFEHSDDPDIEAQLADEFHSKTTVTSLDDLDDDAGFGDTPVDEDPPEEFGEEDAFDEFNYSSDEATDPAMVMPEDSEESTFEESSEASFESSDEWAENSDEDEFPNNDEDSFEDQNEFPEEAIEDPSEDFQDEATASFTEEPTGEFSIEDSEDSSEDSEEEDSNQFAEDSEDFGENQDLDTTEDQLEEEVQQELQKIDEEDHAEENSTEDEFPAQSPQESFLDQMSSPVPPVENFQSGNVMSSSNEFQTSLSAGSMGQQELEGYDSKHMATVAEGISDSVPEIPRISTTYDDFKQNVENLSYAPSPEATGPLFAIHIKGSLYNYKDHIQSIFDEYMIDINLNEETYLMPLQSGFLQVSRISEYILIQLTNSLSKYGFTIQAFYLEDIISPENIDELESKGLESEHNLPQNLADHAEFAEANDWDEDDVLITVTSGPKGYKVLKRCGIAQKMITLSRQDFENLQANFTKFFSDDIHLSGSSTLMDGLIEKIHNELKEDAREKGANCMVNFKLEQTLDINVVILHFSADLLYLRKLNEY